MIELIDPSITEKNFITLKKTVDNLFATEKFETAERIFMEAFAETGSEAIEGNIVCQDFLAYLYKNGYMKIIPENYSLFMKWEILAAANGNRTAMDKMMIFFNYAINLIYNHEHFNRMLTRNEIKSDDINHALCKLLAEGMVDELKINAKELVKTTKAEPYSMATLRTFREALDKTVPKVIQYLLS